MMQVLNKYRFGSYVYGTWQPGSDEDFICITDKPGAEAEPDTQYYTREVFQRLLDHHEIAALECYFLPDRFILRQSYAGFTFNLDKGRLRVSISTMSANSWVKGKKKLTVPGDYDERQGIKSVFHAIRILELGIQLAQTARINDYSACNWLYEALCKLAAAGPDRLWERIDDRYRKLYHKLQTQFRELCPKTGIPQHRLKLELIGLFRENDCYTTEVVQRKLVDKIIQLVHNTHDL
ncbi:nucleotidyltransferase domain-containing protein [Taibaiella chishuiensis]|nr:nucleotidyltransferase domain-containing protein [Taibaiella chishuiensis]